MELTDAVFNRVCDLMNAKKTDENHMMGFSLEFCVANVEYLLTFGLPDELVVFWQAKPLSTPDTQFLFKCNGVEIDPRSTTDRYMLCFTDEHDGKRIPRMLIAGGTTGDTQFRFYSIPGNRSIEEFQFLEQL